MGIEPHRPKGIPCSKYKKNSIAMFFSSPRRSEGSWTLFASTTPSSTTPSSTPPSFSNFLLIRMRRPVGSTIIHAPTRHVLYAASLATFAFATTRATFTSDALPRCRFPRLSARNLRVSSRIRTHARHRIPQRRAHRCATLANVYNFVTNL